MLKPIFGVDFGSFPIYQLMLCVGFVVGLLVFNGAAKRLSASTYIKRHMRFSLFIGTLAGLLAANVINWFVYEYALDYSLTYRLTQGGFTFYFGMLAFFGVSALLLRLFKVRVKTTLNATVPALLIAHFCGRLGCALRGCCWGETVTLFGREILFPARELEAVALLVLFILLLRKKTFNKRIPIYLFSYSALRFGLEFFRGDDRGTLFGIETLSPTQLVAAVVVVISAVWLFTRPICKLCKKEEALDRFQAKLRGIFVGKRVYEPHPLNFEPAKPVHALKIISLILAIHLSVFAAVAALGSVSWDWTDGIRDVFVNVFDGLFDGDDDKNVVGTTNGASVVDVTAHGRIADAQAALTVIQACDDWAPLTYDEGKTLTLPTGNKAYVFNQTVEGKAVLGKTQMLVTDAADNALYVVGDAATMTFGEEKKSAPMARAKMDFGGYKVLSQEEYWFDTGSELVPIYLAILTEDGTTPLMGAIVEKATQRVLGYTYPDGYSETAVDEACVSLASGQVRFLLNEGKIEKLEELSKKKVSGSAMVQKYVTLSKALSVAYFKADLTATEFITVLDAVDAIVTATDRINIDLYADIFVEEYKSLLKMCGLPQEELDRCVDKVEQAMERSGIRQSEDKAATAIAATESQSTYRYAIDFAGDVDVYLVSCDEGSDLTLSFDTDIPLFVEVFNQDKETVSTLFVEGEGEIPVYVEDGNAFIVRVSDRRKATAADTDDYRYKLAVKATPREELTPDYVADFLEDMEKSYNDSDIDAFISLISDDLMQSGDVEGMEVITELGGFGAILDGGSQLFDSCSACVGLEDSVDTAKMIIALCLVPRLDNAEWFQQLRGTDMELSCLRYIVREDTTLVKARLRIMQEGLCLYDGFTFFAMEEAERQKLPNEEEDSAMSAVLDVLSRGKYWITEIKTEELFAAFGDTIDNINASYGLNSLYEFYYPLVKSKDGFEVTLFGLDKEEALADGHSEEQVKGFAAYVKQKNLGILKNLSLSCSAEQLQNESMANIVDTVAFGVEFYMDPIGTGLDWVLEQHDLENAGTAVELISAIVGGWDKFFEFLMDETGSDLGDQVKESYRSEYEKRAAEAEKRQKILAAWIEEEMKK